MSNPMKKKTTPQLDVALAALLGTCQGISEVLQHNDPWTPEARQNAIHELRTSIDLVTSAVMPSVAIVRDDDWSAMYVDGELRAEGHKIPPELAARALGAEIDHSMDAEDISAFIDHAGGRFPGTLAALKARKWVDPIQEVLQP